MYRVPTKIGIVVRRDGIYAVCRPLHIESHPLPIMISTFLTSKVRSRLKSRFVVNRTRCIASLHISAWLCVGTAYMPSAVPKYRL